MSDVTYRSPTELASYAACPRQYDYEYVQGLESPDETRLYLNQGLAYHATVEEVCDATDPDDSADVVHERALSAFDEQWAAHLEPDEYESEAHRAYQRAENRAAIASFFDPDDGDGVDHARRSVATETWVEFVRDGIGLHGKVDNVLRTEDGLHLIDYKRSVSGVLGSWAGDRLVEHRDGERYEPRRVKNAFQTAVYLEGIRETPYYEPGMDLRFSFYGLLHDRERTPTPDGYEVSVDGRARETTAVYEEYRDTIWGLIEAAHDGISNADYEPERFERLQREACPECTYRQTCVDYLEAVTR